MRIDGVGVGIGKGVTYIEATCVVGNLGSSRALDPFIMDYG